MTVGVNELEEKLLDEKIERIKEHFDEGLKKGYINIHAPIYIPIPNKYFQIGEILQVAMDLGYAGGGWDMSQKTLGEEIYMVFKPKQRAIDQIEKERKKKLMDD
ncbi:MAG: hypothetical protein ABIB43_05795 [archaeon]